MMIMMMSMAPAAVATADEDGDGEGEDYGNCDYGYDRMIIFCVSRCYLEF